MKEESFILWEDTDFKIITPSNPHTPQKEGVHLVVLPKKQIASAWEDVETGGKAFMLAGRACKTLKRLNLGDWFNLQANGNWGLHPGKKPLFHIHIYARIKGSDTWGKPVRLPDLPGAFHNEPMSAENISMVTQGLRKDL